MRSVLRTGSSTGEYSLRYSCNIAVLTFRSALGVYDGSVYESLWERTRTEPLNQTDVIDGYEVCLTLLMI